MSNLTHDQHKLHHNTVISDDELIILLDCELETLRRAAQRQGMDFDPNRRKYTIGELRRFGLVREGYTRDEIRAHGFGIGPVTCHDTEAISAEQLLPVETPFGSGIKKWQLPFDMMPFRMMKTVFQPGTIVRPHVHPAASEEDPGGGLRIVTQGEILYDGKSYAPGDWFYIPNGMTYEFITSPDQVTVCFYKYGFFMWTEQNRFSHPHD
ncbi:MAG: hypothetical protein AAGD43_22530 [Pseudomonadota bacterium]